MENKSSANNLSSEKQDLPYRSSRFYSVVNEWYFSVREEKDQGPYPSKLTAENSLKKYILKKKNFKLNKIQLLINNLKFIPKSKYFTFRNFPR